MLSRKLGPALFAGVCLAMAVTHKFWGPLDGIFIGLILLAAVPWFVPWLVPLISSLKVGGLELNFRELKAQVDENKQMVQATAAAVMTGVGKAPAATARLAPEPAAAGSGGEYLAHAAMAPAFEGAAAAAAPEESDPNKGAFGGRRERDGFRLDAEVKPVAQSTDFFLVHAWVESVPGRRPLRDGTEVTVHLHPTFAEQVVRVKAAGGIAAIDRMAWGAFTIGAEVEGVRLELDLATDVPSAPAVFRSR